jgi:hypothetical protein
MLDGAAFASAEEAGVGFLHEVVDVGGGDETAEVGAEGSWGASSVANHCVWSEGGESTGRRLGGAREEQACIWRGTTQRTEAR